MDDELKPCPFCGSEAVVEVIPGIRSPITRWSVNCPNLDCGPVSESREEAVAWWNRRAALSQPASPVPEAIAWESTTTAYTKYISDRRYRLFSDAARRWYKPYRCTNCAESPAPEAIEDMCARIKAADDAAADGGYMLDSQDCISVLRGTWKGPLAMDMPAKPSTVEQAIDALVTALAASKGWMRDYADAVVRDAIDRRPHAMTDEELSEQTQGWPFQEAFDFKLGVRFAEGRRANGAEAWKDVPRTGDWVADAGGETK